MQLPDGSFLKMLLCSRDVMALGQVLNDLLADPASIQDTGFGVGKPPFQIRDNSVVSGLLAEVVGVFSVNLVVGTA